MDSSRSHGTKDYWLLPGHSTAALVPILAAVFVGFLVIGLALPVLPLHVHQDLGLGTFLVGLVAGSQFAAAILSRAWAGRQADTRGPKQAVVAGLAIASGSGLIYLVSLSLIATPNASLGILLLGRALLGVGESFIITGGQSWALAILTVRNTSKALAWIGSAMFAAFAAGAPIGSALYARYGFSAIALTTMLLPLATLLCVVPLHSVASVPRMQAGFMRVMASVWFPGLGAALSSIGFGAITAFSALLFVARGWAAWPAFTVFASVFILTRLFLGHLGDRFIAAKVALICVLVEAAGLALIWLSSSLALALTGAALTGFGYSLVYPSLGVRSHPRRACGEPRARHGRIHRVSRRRTWLRHSGSWLPRRSCRPGQRIWREHVGGYWRSGHRGGSTEQIADAAQVRRTLRHVSVDC
jgi:MFS family permease